MFQKLSIKLNAPECKHLCIRLVSIRIFLLVEEQRALMKGFDSEQNAAAAKCIS